MVTDDLFDFGPVRCPECQAGKCGNCDGSAWDVETDSPVLCPHYEQDHPGWSPA